MEVLNVIVAMANSRSTRWQPMIAMAFFVFLGIWVSTRTGSVPKFPLAPDAIVSRVQIGESRGVLEAFRRDEGSSTEVFFRLWLRDGPAIPRVMSQAEAEAILGARVVHRSMNDQNWLFRILNITNWASVGWVAIGFFGQFMFSGRMILQWLISERHERSVVTESFWWFSLLGGVTLFCYFVWRQDPVPVIGQASGIVVYARNIQMLRKHKKPAVSNTHKPEAA